MAYNSSKGPQTHGDVQYEGDPAETQIDFENDFVAIKTNGLQRLIVSGSYITASVPISCSVGITAQTMGIGTDNPDGKLHVMAASAGSVTVTGDQAKGIIVENNDSSAITLLDPAGGVIYFGDAADTDIGRIGYRHGGDYANSMYFTTNNAQRMAIDSAGKVGIGTPAPTHTLTVVGQISASLGVSGSSLRTAATVIDTTHISSSLNISGSKFYGDGSTLSGVGAGTMSSWTLSADGGSNQAITEGNTVDIAGGTGITTAASATDTVTVNLDNTAVTPNPYTYASITVDQQGRLTAASSGTPPPITTYSNAADNRVVTSVNSTSVQGEAGLTYNGSMLAAAGEISASLGVTGSSVRTATTVIDATHISSSLNISGSKFYGDGSTLSGVGAGTMSSFTLAGDAGSSQTITDGNTLTVAGGTGLSSAASATDTLTVNLDNTAVTAASYTYSAITVDAQGRLTAASNGTGPPITSYTNQGNNRIITSVDSSTVNAEAGLTYNGSILSAAGQISASLGVSGSSLRTATTVIDATHVSSSLNISGSKFYGDGANLTNTGLITSYTNSTDNRVLTSVNSSTVNGEANLTFDGSALAVAGTLAATVANNPVAQFTHPTDDSTGAVLELINSKAGAAGDADDFCGGVVFKSTDSTSAATQYGKISTKIGSPTNTSEAGYMLFDITTAGTAATTYLRLDGVTSAVTASVAVSASHGITAGSLNTLTTVIDGLHVSSSLNISGSRFYGDGSIGSLDVTNLTSLYGHMTFKEPTTLSANAGLGEVAYYGSEHGTDTLAAGKLMYLSGSTTGSFWRYADADAEASSGPVQLGIALGNAVSDGVLLRGYFHASALGDSSTFVTGGTCYVGLAAGTISFTRPSAAGDVIRAIGHGIAAEKVIYFNPSYDWFQL